MVIRGVAVVLRQAAAANVGDDDAAVEFGNKRRHFLKIGGIARQAVQTDDRQAHAAGRGGIVAGIEAQTIGGRPPAVLVHRDLAQQHRASTSFAGGFNLLGQEAGRLARIVRETDQTAIPNDGREGQLS